MTFADRKAKRLGSNGLSAVRQAPRRRLLEYAVDGTSRL